MNPELQDTLNEFLLTLEEVDILLSSAERSINEETKYAAYNKLESGEKWITRG